MTPYAQARQAIRTLASYLDVDGQTGRTHLSETAPPWIVSLYQHLLADDDPLDDSQVIAWAVATPILEPAGPLAAERSPLP